MPRALLHLIPLVCLANMLSATPASRDSSGAGGEYDGVVLAAPDEKAVRSLRQKAIPTRVTIDENASIKPFSRQLFGFNYDWELMQSLFLPPGATEPDPDIARHLRGVRLPLNRVAGSDSKRFRWKDAIGDPDMRPVQKLWDWSPGKSLRFGPVEWIRWIHQTDPDAAFSWVVNLNESPDDIRDLARFLLGAPDQETGPDGGADWAARRVELGIEKPVNVAIWEIGNEMDLGDDTRRWTVERYLAAAGPAIAAIRGVDPGAVIAVHATSSPWAPPRPGRQPWRHWHREVLRALGDQIDLLVFHPYYNGIPLSQVEGYMDAMRDDIRALTGGDRIKLYHSEHAVWPPMPPDGNWRKNWYQTHSLGGSLNTALFLVRCINRSDTVAAAYHSFNSGPWGLIYREPESGRLFTTGIAAMFSLLGRIDGSDVLPVRLDGDGVNPQDPGLRFAVAAVKRRGGLQLVLVNRGEAPRAITLDLRSPHRIAGAQILTGSDAHLRNSASLSPLAPAPFPLENPAAAPSRTHRFDLPALSLVLVELYSNN